MAKKRARKQPIILRYEELEQRVLFSADGVPGLDIDGVHEQVMTEDFAMDEQAVPKAPEQTVEQNDETVGWELVFINENVTDYEQLIVDMDESPGNRIIEVVVIDSHDDGIEQVSKALAERSELTAVHFITHGANGQINLGDAWLNSTSLEQNREAVAQWGNALTATGDVLFYGCNIAANTDGQSLLNRISQLTGADAAASGDMTGNSDQGGDWDLEYLSGAIETEISVRSDQQQGWFHLLAPPAITSNGGGNTADIDVAENTTTVTTVTATGTPAYSISGGADQGKFTIHGTTGELTFNAPPDFEAKGDGDGDNVYTVTVTASDDGDDTQDISVHVTNVNEAPVNTAPTPLPLVQNGMLIFSSDTNTAVSISDPEADASPIDNPLQVTLTAANGTLNLPGTKGLTFAAGDGTADATMIFTGTIDDINTAMEGMTFMPTPGFIGTTSVEITTDDQTANGGPMSDTDEITIIVTPNEDDSLWLSTNSAGNAGGLPWNNGEIVQFSNPNFALSQDQDEPSTNGNFTSILDFNANINALHYVTRDLNLGGGADTLSLLAGDILFSTDNDQIFNGLTVQKQDIALFRPNNQGDYTSGVFIMVLDDPAAGTDIRGVTLVQNETTVGSETLTPGDFLLLREGAANKNSIWRYEPTGVGENTTAGTLTEFIESDSAEVGISPPLNSIHLIEEDTMFGGIRVDKGNILATMGTDDNDIGNNHIEVEKYDVFCLSVVSTGVGNSVAQASLLFDGSDVDINSPGEEFDALTLLWYNQTPRIGNKTHDMAENSASGPPVVTITHMGPEMPFSYTLIAGNTNGGFKIDRTSGEISVANSVALDFETTPTFILTAAAIDSQGVYDTATITISLNNVNDPPTIEINTGITVEKGSTGNTITAAMLKAEDHEDSAANLTYKLTANVSNGTLKLGGAALIVGNEFTQADIDNNLITYDHDDSATLSNSFEFSVTDNEPEAAKSVDSTFTITVNPVNPNAPLIDDLTALVAEDAALTTLVTDLKDTNTLNDTDLDGTALIYSITAGNGDGVFTIDANTGEITIANTTNLDHETTASYALTVEASDGTRIDTATITVNITDSNDPVGPVSDTNAGGNTVAEDAQIGDPAGITALATDPDPGDTITYSLTNDAAGRFAIDINTGAVTVAGALDYDIATSHTITVQAESSDSSTSTQAFTINITQVNNPPVIMPPVNHPPMAVDARINAFEDTVYNGTLPMATDPDGDPVTYTLASAPENGTAVVNADGRFSYTPHTDFNGIDTFTYTVKDGNGGMDTATVTMDINPVNDSPMAADGIINALEDTVRNGNLPMATDPEGDPVTYTLESAPQNGTAVVNADGRFSYTPHTDFNGIDTFTYTAEDGNGGMDTATMTMDINPVNDLPMAADGIINALEDTVCNRNLPMATDPEGDPVTYTLESAPKNGTAVVNPDGRFSYTPHTDFNGIDTFTYTVEDGNGGMDSATMTMDVGAVNDGPRATNAGINGVEDTAYEGHLPMATDPEGDPVTYTLESTPKNGTAVVDTDGRFSYTPNTDFNGIDTFTYTVEDGNGGMDSATMTMDINPVNDLPMAADGIINALEDTVCNGNLPMATDPEGDPVTYTLESAPENGTAVVNADGRFSYTPHTDFNGIDTFTYTVEDGNGGMDTATVTMDINPVNDLPMAADGIINALEDTVCNGNLPMATDPEGDPVTYTLENSSGNGTAVVNPDGRFNYTPHADFNGIDTFTYTVKDGNGGSSAYTMTVHVAAVTDSPTFTSAPVTEATEDTAYSYHITTGDVDGTPLTISATPLPSWLTLVDKGDGTATLSGTPTHAEMGDHSVGLEVSNGGLPNTLNFNINVLGTTITPRVVDSEPYDNGEAEGDSEPILKEPEANKAEDSAGEEQTDTAASDPSAKYETMAPVKADPFQRDATDREDSIEPIKEMEAETTETILSRSFENDMGSQSKDRKDDRSPIYFDKDPYKEISSLKTLAFDHNAGNNGANPMGKASIGNLDFNDGNTNPVDINSHYDQLRQEINQSFNIELNSQAFKAKIITITSATFTVGIVSYLLRAGSLVASLISTLPVWCGFDPIAIFSGTKTKQKIKTDEISDTHELKTESLFDGEAE